MPSTISPTPRTNSSPEMAAPSIPRPLSEMLEANKEHQANRTSPPDLLTMSKFANQDGQGTFVITCSDPRLNPYRILGLDEAHEARAVMIRNAGGRTFDVQRTLGVLGRIGNPGTIVVMHHTDCGMTHFHDSYVKEHLYSMYPEAGEQIEGIKRYGEILGPIEESIHEDVELLRGSPFVKPGTTLIGLKYDVFSGKLEVLEQYTR